jgi:peptidase E
LSHRVGGGLAHGHHHPHPHQKHSIAHFVTGSKKGVAEESENFATEAVHSLPMGQRAQKNRKIKMQIEKFRASDLLKPFFLGQI